MPYSASQQSQIDNANAQVATAKSAMDSAYATAKPAHDNLFKCVAGKGSTSNCKDGQPLGAGKFPTFGNLASAGDCKICNALKDCKSDCCKEETCVNRVNDYNSAIGVYNVAKKNYDTAKSNLDSVLNSIGQEVQNDPSVIATTNEINANASVKKQKWTFFGLAVLVIIGSGIYLGLKTEIKKGYIIGGGVGLILLLYVVFFGFKKS